MHEIDDESIRGVLGEALMDQLKAIRECLDDKPGHQEFQLLRDDVNELNSNMIVVKAAVTDTNIRLSGVESEVKKQGREIHQLKLNR